MTRGGMRRRTRNLALLEVGNIGFSAVVVFGLAGVPAGPANVVGYGLVAVLLAQGAAYWAVKFRQLRVGAKRPAGLPVFAALRWINPVLLAAAAVVIVGSVWSDPGARTWPGAAFWLVAAAEHVNYFHVQLMYDTRDDLRRLIRDGRPRPSHLAMDLRVYRSADGGTLPAVIAPNCPRPRSFG